MPTYFTGYSEWKRLRSLAEQKPGFKAGAFNERALREGALPMRTLGVLLGLQ